MKLKMEKTDFKWLLITVCALTAVLLVLEYVI